MKASKGTIIRTVVLFIALLNSLFVIMGINPLPISEEQVTGLVEAIYTVASIALLLFSTIVTWWKNNSFTKEALEADKTLKKLKTKK